MDEFFDLPTLIVIGLAIVILFRLRSVLGTRTGNERSPLERRGAEAPPKTGDDTVVQMRPRPDIRSDEDAERQARRLAAEIEQFAGGDEQVAAGIKAIAEADPTFGPKSFLEGAKAAYEMVVVAYAEGDRRTLKNLLDKEVYEGFERTIAEREASGRKVDFTFVGLPKIEIAEAELDKRNAVVTVRFHAEVVSATLESDGTLVEGSTEQVNTIADEWTFARSTKSRDPNWKVVATRPLE